MLQLYKCLLWLYPTSHRREYGEEMTAVFHEARTEIEKKGVVTRSLFWLREIRGLVCGAIAEHIRSLACPHSWLPLPARRFTMHSEFRFPKATAVLMALIFAGNVL